MAKKSLVDKLWEDEKSNALTNQAARHIEKLESVLTFYQKQFCEGFCKDMPKGVYNLEMDEQCSGCKARAALTGDMKNL